MINLLPDLEKRELRAARTNSLLIRYNIALIASVVFLGVALGIVYYFLNATKASAETAIAESRTKASSFAAVESEAQLFRANLATAKQILDKEVSYSKVILAIANVMPSGTTLDKLSLNSQDFGKPTTIVAQAKSYEAALSLKGSFEKSSLFSDVHFQSIAANPSAQTSGYSFIVNLDVTIKKEAAK